jgi:hypothetical protein
MWTAELPKIQKRFVAPGRKTPPPPERVSIVSPPPDFNFIHADPAMSAPARLTLPAAPPPMMDVRPPKLDRPEAVPAIPAGDPVNVISLNNRAVPLEEKLVVPAGNLYGKSGNAVAAAQGSKEPDRIAPQASEVGAARMAPAVLPSATTLSGVGKSTAVTNTVGTSAGSSTGTGGGKSNGPGQVIVRPRDGRFDAMVVQSSSLDQFPEGKGLLTGRPIYTVYLSLGTAKDWAMYFCVPNEKQAESRGFVVTLGPVPPVQAPYPTRMIRPDVAIPGYYKYVLVHGFITDGGRFQDVKIVRPISPDSDRNLLASLVNWEFRAATKDGVKITVEFLLSIPVIGL